MKSLRNTIFSILALCLMLAACTQVGLAPADGFEQKLAYGYSTVAAVRTSAAQALTAGTIDIVDAKKTLAVTDEARAGLDAAGAANGHGDTSTAIGKLATATALLTQLQQYLIAKGAKP